MTIETLQDLLGELSRLEVRLELHDGQLRVDAPAGALSTELRQRLREHREHLVAQLAAAARGPVDETLTIVEDIAERNRPFTLNPVQHAYWIGRQQQVELGGVSSHVYFEIDAVDLDLERLAAALNRLIRRHEMLRAVVDADGRQRILPEVPDYAIVAVELSDREPGQRAAGLDALRGELASRRIDCASWPLFEIRAARIDNRTTRLCTSWDFIFLDAWSLRQLFHEWHRCYLDPGLELAPLRLSFRDYVLAEQRSRESTGFRTDEAYWQQRLDALPAAPALPLVAAGDEPAQGHVFTRRSRVLTPERWQALKSGAQRAGLTPSSLLLAAFAEVLGAWCRSPHYTLNLTLFNRQPVHPDIERVIGDFTNLMLLEVDGRKGATFLERAQAIQEQFLSDFEHRRYGAIDVLRELGKRRRAPRKALAPVVFTSALMLESSADRAGDLEQFGPLGWGLSQTPQVLLDYQIFDSKGVLRFNWDAAEAQFLPGVLDAMFEANATLLDRLADDPAAWMAERLVELPEPQRLRRVEANATATDIAPRCLQQAFVANALAAPDRIALIEGDRRLGYGELLREAGAVAAELVRRGVRPGQLVAVLMDKRCEQVVALIGVLLSGAAYLPIDPSWPARRRDDILERCAVHHVLVDDDGAATLLPEAVTALPLRLGVAAALDAAPVQRQSQDDLAYVIFTSGSTGTPKGVMIDHRSAMNTIDAINRLLEVAPSDRALMVSEASFDLSVYDIFGMLAVGGAVVLPQRRFGRDPQHWLEQIARHSVTVWNSVPQLMGLLVDAAEAAGSPTLGTLRKVLLSGDWIPTALPDRVRRCAPRADLLSLGGATEGSIWSISFPIEAVDPRWASIPYGKALPNQRVYVFDRNYAERPDWVVGDIYIGGAGVALGYWRDPERTAERFLRHPVSGERLYWTGDLGRYLPDGNIEFLGREDAQIKLRGYRLELGEIAATLRGHRGVADAVVKAIKTPQRLTLAAYVVPNGNDASLFESSAVDEEAARAIDRAAAHAGRAAEASAAIDDLRHFDTFWRDLDGLCRASMLAGLASLGLASTDDFDREVRRRIDEGRVRAEHRRLLTRWRDHLAADPLESQPLSIAEQVADFREAYGRDPRTADFAGHVMACIERQADLLSGAVAPLALLFPEGDWRHADALYRDNAVVRQHNATLSAIVGALVDRRPGAEPFRVIELGAGTGGSTGAVLRELSAESSDYLYTDVSSYFFEQARRRLAGHPQLRFGTFDIDRSATAQGVSTHAYDLVVAANVLHNARDLDVTLGQVRDLLKPGGRLLLLEGTALTAWSLATVGFLEGDAEFSDGRAGVDGPILDAAAWRCCLERNGYADVAVFPDEDAGIAALLAAMPQRVILARAPSRVQRFAPESLLSFLSERVPDYMVPQHVVALERFPLSANGKVDLEAMPSPVDAGSVADRAINAPSSALESRLLALWSRVLGATHLGVTDNFFDVGGDSLLLTEVQRRVHAELDRELSVADLFTYPTVQSLAHFLDASSAPEAAPAPAPAPEAATDPIHASRDIAVIGLAGRFPDAPDVDQLWRNLESGACAVRRFEPAELRDAGVDPADLENPNYVFAAPVLADMDCFDAAYFGIAPAEAEMMDPQQRFLLECAVETLENAGYPSEKRGQRIGVFVGKGIPLYTVEHVLSHPERVARYGVSAILRDADKDHAATQISYKLNLTGPSLSVNTACSTSLVAVHVACRSLIAGECEMALAGAASFVTTLAKSGYLYEPGQICSPDGLCKAFSENADGAAFGCGVGMVALKPLAAAQRDGDHIHAVIRGTAINNDGSNKVGYTAPSMSQQAQVIGDALANAGLAPGDLQYVEAHGTGTPLGDPIEVAALRRVFGAQADGQARVALGSIKTNIGHLDAAAGVAGLIKVVLALRHCRIPASLNVSTPSSKLELDGSPFFINTELRDWQAEGPRRAGVSSFGVGGTNAHVIVEEAPAPAPRASADGGPQLYVLSAKHPEALTRNAARLASHLARGDGAAAATADIAYTLKLGRAAHSYRRYVVADSIAELRRQLADGVAPGAIGRSAPLVAFLFPGQGSSFRGLAALHACAPEFARAFDRCAELVLEFAGIDLRDQLSRPDDPAAMPAVLAQPLLFSVGYALAQHWLALGVRPAAMLGHSLGEYVAACIAGVFSLEEALSLVVIRGRLSDSLPAGRMAAVAMSEERLVALVTGSGCSIAAVNGPSQCVVSGGIEAMAALLGRLEAAGIPTHPLKTSVAYHSDLLDGVTALFEQCLAEIALSAPSMPYVSSLSGEWIRAEQATSPAYWARHFRQTVRFADAVETLRRTGDYLFVEVGVDRVLCGLLRPLGVPAAAVVASVDGANPARSSLVATGELWSRGVAINWEAQHGDGAARRVALPAYAFEKARHWLPRRRPLAASAPAPAVPPPVTLAATVDVSPDAPLRRDPRNPIEARLRGIWHEYLGVDGIGIDDNFFDLGGDSVMGARIHARVGREFDIEFPIDKLFELDTVRRQYLFLVAHLDPASVEDLADEDVDELSRLLACEEDRR